MCCEGQLVKIRLLYEDIPRKHKAANALSFSRNFLLSTNRFICHELKNAISSKWVDRVVELAVVLHLGMLFRGNLRIAFDLSEN